MLTVGDLKRAIEGLPDDMPVSPFLESAPDEIDVMLLRFSARSLDAQGKRLWVEMAVSDDGFEEWGDWEGEE